MRYDLFISHSSADAGTARALVTDFENRGISCWLAARDVPMGSSYQIEIVSAIEQCRAVLLLFSDSANRSEHVLREVELAAQGRKPIYPLRIDASEPMGGLKYMLANKQWVERKALGNRLVDTIEQLLAPSRAGGADTPPSRPPAAPPPAPTSRAGLMIGAGLAACALLVAGIAWQGGWLSPKPVVVTATPATSPTPDPPKQITAAAPAASPPVTSAAPPPAQPQPPPAAALPPPAAPSPMPAATPAPPIVAQPPVSIPSQPPVAAASQPPAAAPSQPPAVVPPPTSTPSQPPAAVPSQPPAAAPVQEARLPVALPAGADQQKPEIAGSAPTMMEAVPGKTLFRECDMCPVMAVMPAGSNRIGSPGHESGRSDNEGPQQDIVIRQPLAVGRSEIAFEEWLACVAEGGCNAYRPGDYEWGYDRQPAINVSWNDAKAYVDWLSKKTKATYRLLSEAEWEYAARGCARVCESTPFWFGEDISKARANYDWRFAYLGSPKAQPLRRTVPVDQSEPNPFGLLHVHGNVREWVEDCWNASLAGLPRDGAARTTGDCRSHVVRGGSWADEPKDVRSAKRSWEVAGERRAQIGFRVARELRR